MTQSSKDGYWVVARAYEGRYCWLTAIFGWSKYKHMAMHFDNPDLARAYRDQCDANHDHDGNGVATFGIQFVPHY